MAYTKTIKRGTSEASTLSNKLVTERDLRLKIQQLVNESEFNQIEPVEVLKVYPYPTEDKVDGVDYGRIVGRYCVSEHDLNPEDCKDFIPLYSNIMQLPMEHEIVLGIEFKGIRYYFSSMNNTPSVVNYQRKHLSATGANPNLDDILEEYLPEVQAKAEELNKDIRNEKLKYFKNKSRPKLVMNQGDTLIHGRHNNYIKLGSEQELQSGDIDINVDTNEVEIQSYYLSPKNRSSIFMTSKRDEPYNKYSNQVIDYGREMKLYSFGKPSRWKNELKTNNYKDAQIYLSSDRLVLSAEQDDIAIFAKNNVHNKGKKVQIENRGGGVDVAGSRVTTDYVGGSVVAIGKELGPGVILAPEMTTELGAILAKQVEINIEQYKVQLESLIPSGLIGKPYIPSPQWFNNIRNKIKVAKKWLDWNKLVMKLSWLDKTRWRTYTIDDIKAAFAPLPAIGNIIVAISSLQALATNIKAIVGQVEATINNLKAQLSEPLKNVANYLEELRDKYTVNFDKKIQSSEISRLKIFLESLNSTNQKLSNFENAEYLYALTEKFETRLDEFKTYQFTPKRKTYSDALEETRKQIQEFIVGGNANSFKNRIFDIETEIESTEAAIPMLEQFAEIAVEGEKIQKQIQLSQTEGVDELSRDENLQDKIERISRSSRR